MKTASLFIKIKNKKQLIQTKKIIQSLFEDIEVEIALLGTTKSGWLKVSVKGADEQIAINYLIKEIGICPESIVNISKDQNINGRISDFYENELLLVDLGISKPKTFMGEISLESLQDQLSLDKKINLKQIINLFGLTKELPIQVNVENIQEEKNSIQVKLSKHQLSLFTFWKNSLLDRLILQGITYGEAKKATKLLGFNRDVIKIESLDLFTQVLTCKLGTQAIGLIPRLGKLLKATKITVFNPKNLFPDL